MRRCNDCLVVCHNHKSAVNLYGYMLNHFAGFNIPLRTNRARREFSILTTDIRVVSYEEYIMKCHAGFRGKVISETEAWRMMDEDKKHLERITPELRREGVEYTCTRCGKVEFQPYHPLKSKYPDEKPKEWLILDKDTVHLCPHCAEAYINLLEKFIGGDT